MSGKGSPVKLRGTGVKGTKPKVLEVNHNTKHIQTTSTFQQNWAEMEKRAQMFALLLLLPWRNHKQKPQIRLLLPECWLQIAPQILVYKLLNNEPGAVIQI